MQPSENDVYFPHKEAALELEAKQRLLEDLAARVGLEVCYEPMDTGRRRSSAGGLCRLRSQLLVLIDEGAPRVEQIGVLLDALSQFDVEAMFVPPMLRLELARRRR